MGRKEDCLKGEGTRSGDVRLETSEARLGQGWVRKTEDLK